MIKKYSEIESAFREEFANPVEYERRATREEYDRALQYFKLGWLSLFAKLKEFADVCAEDEE